LVDPKVGRNVMLEMTRPEAAPNVADNFFRQCGAKAPILACHVNRSFTWRDLAA
jgi:hypothetical protein